MDLVALVGSVAWLGIGGLMTWYSWFSLYRSQTTQFTPRGILRCILGLGLVLACLGINGIIEIVGKLIG